MNIGLLHTVLYVQKRCRDDRAKMRNVVFTISLRMYVRTYIHTYIGSNTVKREGEEELAICCRN